MGRLRIGHPGIGGIAADKEYSTTCLVKCGEETIFAHKLGRQESIFYLCHRQCQSASEPPPPTNAILHESYRTRSDYIVHKSAYPPLLTNHSTRITSISWETNGISTRECTCDNRGPLYTRLALKYATVIVHSHNSLCVLVRNSLQNDQRRT